MGKYIELKIGPIIEDSCTGTYLALRDVFGRYVVIIADIDKDHQFDRVDEYFILSDGRRYVALDEVSLHHALYGLLADIRSHHPFFLQAGEALAA